MKEVGALTRESGRAYDEAALLELLGMGTPQDGEQEQLADGLMPLVVGLRRTGRLSPVLAALRDAAALKAKSFIRYCCKYCQLMAFFASCWPFSHTCSAKN
jgi:hypothetical protein